MRRPTLSPAEDAAIREFMRAVRDLLGGDLREARLFGSRARGEGNEYSDLDIALIVAPGVRRRRHAIYDLAYDIGFAHGVELAPLVIDAPQFQELKDRELLIARTIESEGVPL